MNKKLKIFLSLAVLSSLVVIGMMMNRFFQVKNFTENLKISQVHANVKVYETSEVSNDWQAILKAQEVAKEKGVPENACGILEIPSIALELPIFRGTNEWTLSLGASTYFYENAEAGKGNLVLAGHSTPYKNVLFTSLFDVQENEKILVRTEKEKFTYRIDRIETVKDEYKLIDEKVENTSFLALPSELEQPKITLFTCINWQDNTRRLVVSGHLEK